MQLLQLLPTNQVRLYVFSKPSLRIAKRQKAELIRSLTVEACRNSVSENHLAAKTLASILPTLTSLTDLRMRFLVKGETSFSKELNNIIRYVVNAEFLAFPNIRLYDFLMLLFSIAYVEIVASKFQLHTLFCNEWLDQRSSRTNPISNSLGFMGGVELHYNF